MNIRSNPDTTLPAVTTGPAALVAQNLGHAR